MQEPQQLERSIYRSAQREMRKNLASPLSLSRSGDDDGRFGVASLVTDRDGREIPFMYGPTKAYSSSDDSSFNHALFDQVMRLSKDLVITVMKAISEVDPSEAEDLSPTGMNSQPSTNPPDGVNIETNFPSPIVPSGFDNKVSSNVRSSNVNKAKVDSCTATPVESQESCLDGELCGNQTDFEIRNSSTSGKAPAHGPRHAVFPSRYLGDEFVTKTNKFLISKSQIMNYKLLKPGGYVNNFVIAAFCYDLYFKPNGSPDASKRHYFFANVADNLLRHPNEANEDCLMKAFKRSGKTRPLSQTDLIPSFQFWWNKYVGVEKGFDEFGVMYPHVPKQSLDNEYVLSFFTF
ncbi:hypothetical protein C2845_PM15G06320 [Panicum miliaceum]|uniref:Uncharacterized protein n=1 Tax=Panicum miliaceum TaxID=4540 RepID=A0A3L6Q426_PANMI|nr:hypothetical protein C2845_PM15G06320 [Panicum miliaceum]